MGFADKLTINEVCDEQTLLDYMQQVTGCPYPTGKSKAIYLKQVRAFFKQYPHLDYIVLARTADWCRSKKRRFSDAHQIVGQYRYAYSAGAIPEFTNNPERANVDREIDKALETERDQTWRSKLALAQSGALPSAAAWKVVEAWKLARTS